MGLHQTLVHAYLGSIGKSPKIFQDVRFYAHSETTLLELMDKMPVYVPRNTSGMGTSVHNLLLTAAQSTILMVQTHQTPVSVCSPTYGKVIWAGAR